MHIDFRHFVLGHRFDVMLDRLLNFKRKRRYVTVAIHLYAYIRYYTLLLEVKFNALVLCVKKRNPFNFVNSKRNYTANDVRIISNFALLRRSRVMPHMRHKFSPFKLV